MASRTDPGPNASGATTTNTEIIALEALREAQDALASNIDPAARTVAGQAYTLAVTGTTVGGAALGAAIVAQNFATTAWQVGTNAQITADAATLAAATAYQTGTSAYQVGTNAAAAAAPVSTYGTLATTVTFYGTNLAGALVTHSVNIQNGMVQSWAIA
jgi:hypothetical protein